MASYSYKDVCYRGDFQKLVATFKERHGSECDHDPSYLGDYWVVAGELLDEKDAQIATLNAKLKRVVDSVEYMTHTCGHPNSYQCDRCDLSEILREVGR